MRPPLARLSRAGLAVFAAACLTTTFAPSPARATNWVVDQNGGGDFTTIQEALDAWKNGLGWRDYVLVMPGFYAESLTVGSGSPYLLISAEGPSVTTVESLAIADDFGRLYQGFTFAQEIRLSGYTQGTHFDECVFQKGLYGFLQRPPGFENCDFFGRVTLLGLGNPSYKLFSSVHFHSAPLRISISDGDVQMEDCSFEGPADTLVFVEWADSDDPLYLRRCRFENAGFGLASGSPFGIRVESCTFQNLTGAGVWLQPEPLWTGGPRDGSRIERSRFEGCKTAIHWRPAPTPDQYDDGVYLTLDRDTALACGGNALVIGPITDLEIRNCRIDGSGGKGGVVQLDHPADPFSYYEFWETALVRNSAFTNNLAGGLVLQDTSALVRGPRLVDSCTFSRNGGPGLQVNCAAWNVEQCVSFANGGDGFSLDTPAPGYPTLLAFNTSVLNQGDGVGLTAPVHPGDSLHVVQHNLTALNAGTGFRVPHQSFGSFAFNDACGNYQSQYAGAWGSADSNLTVDPRFCDLSAGHLGLQQGSPCGAGGLYGLIGALPEQCPNTAAVETSAPRLSFAVRPTVAHGSAQFVPPTAGPEGRIELFDLSGRRLWGAAFGPRTGTLRWRGESGTGHAPPGLYWVRFTRAGESQSQRLIWLE